MNVEFFVRRNGDRVDFFDSGSGADLLMYHHGTPGAGPLHSDLLDPAAANGLRIVELVRPGYGNSTREPQRTVADVVEIANDLADHLGFDKYVTMGWSGGGPHALANVALSPDRCVAAMSLAGVGMFGQSDLDFLEGMGQDNLDEFGAAVAGEAEIRAFLEPAGAEMANVQGSEIIEMMSTLLPEEDRAALTGEFGENTAEMFRWAIHTGIDGWLDDDIAFVLPWGFDLEKIKNPVTIWQGATDLMVPFAHGQWLASKMPHADVNLLEGHGHLSIGEPALATGFAWLKAQLSK
jgi:pimeloyl-ACP methyl ester carboxylesterase